MLPGTFQLLQCKMSHVSGPVLVPAPRLTTTGIFARPNTVLLIRLLTKFRGPHFNTGDVDFLREDVMTLETPHVCAKRRHPSTDEISNKPRMFCQHHSIATQAITKRKCVSFFRSCMKFRGQNKYVGIAGWSNHRDPMHALI
jgi:hypothetical protein